VLETPELFTPETRQHNPGVMWNVDKLAVKDIGRPVYLTAGDEKLMDGIMNSAPTAETREHSRRVRSQV
jgi:hypothetical protein